MPGLRCVNSSSCVKAGVEVGAVHTDGAVPIPSAPCDVVGKLVVQVTRAVVAFADPEIADVESPSIGASGGGGSCRASPRSASASEGSTECGGDAATSSTEPAGGVVGGAAVSDVGVVTLRSDASREVVCCDCAAGEVATPGAAACVCGCDCVGAVGCAAACASGVNGWSSVSSADVPSPP